jgi:hypothetical protein
MKHMLVEIGHIAREPTLGIEFRNVFTKYVRIIVDDGGIHSDPVALGNVYASQCRTTSRNAPRHRHTDTRMKTHCFFSDRHQVRQFDGLRVPDTGSSECASLSCIVDIFDELLVGIRVAEEAVEYGP